MLMDFLHPKSVKFYVVHYRLTIENIELIFIVPDGAHRCLLCLWCFFEPSSKYVFFTDSYQRIDV